MVNPQLQLTYAVAVVAAIVITYSVAASLFLPVIASCYISGFVENASIYNTSGQTVIYVKTSLPEGGYEIENSSIGEKIYYDTSNLTAGNSYLVSFLYNKTNCIYIKKSYIILNATQINSSKNSH